MYPRKIDCAQLWGRQRVHWRYAIPVYRRVGKKKKQKIRARTKFNTKASGSRGQTASPPHVNHDGLMMSDGA
jgi:hypothetical protein